MKRVGRVSLEAVHTHTHTHTHVYFTKRNNGITLIALVVTIIILLILAGITFASLNGNNGILAQTNKAKEETKMAESEERVRLAEQEASMEEYNNVKVELTEDEATAAGWEWKKQGTDGSEYAYITGYTGSQSEIYIPSKIGNLDVPNMSDSWYALQSSQNREKIKKIVLPGKNYSYITFSDWSGKLPNLETIIIKEGMTEIDSCSYMLAEVKNVHTLIFPSTLQIIWNSYEFGYSYLNEIVIPKSVKKIPENMFSYSKGGPITIYCEAESKPKDWSDKWLDGAPEGTKVIWGYQRANFGKVEENNSTDNSEPTENYVGYYADLNGDGKIEIDKDGIIYADLSVGTTGYGRWKNDSGTKYDIPKETKELRNYTISEENKSGPFGEAKMVSANGTSGAKRFYVMALSDFTTNGPLYDWYHSAFSKMSDYKTYTSQEFGTGESNTRKMIEKWNSKGYGAQNACTSGYKDIWGQIQTKYNEGWFVPSKKEFIAFGGELNITEEKWEKYGFIKDETNSGGYWLSSQSDSQFASLAKNGIFSSGVTSHRRLRLSTTF